MGSAVAECQRRGKSVRFTVEVGPGGKLKVSGAEAAAGESGRREDPRDGRKDLERALEEAHGRGRSRMAEILGGEDMLSADQLARRIGTTRATVNAWRHKRRLLGLEGATRGFRFPAWQIGDDGKPFEAMPELFDRLGGHPWAVYRFLVQRHPELGGLSGREALRRGKAAEAVSAAEGVASSFA